MLRGAIGADRANCHVGQTYVQYHPWYCRRRAGAPCWSTSRPAEATPSCSSSSPSSPCSSWRGSSPPSGFRLTNRTHPTQRNDLLLIIHLIGKFRKDKLHLFFRLFFHFFLFSVFVVLVLSLVFSLYNPLLKWESFTKGKTDILLWNDDQIFVSENWFTRKYAWDRSRISLTDVL